MPFPPTTLLRVQAYNGASVDVPILLHPCASAGGQWPVLTPGCCWRSSSSSTVVHRDEGADGAAAAASPSSCFTCTWHARGTGERGAVYTTQLLLLLQCATCACAQGEAPPERQLLPVCTLHVISVSRINLEGGTVGSCCCMPCLPRPCPTCGGRGCSTPPSATAGPPPPAAPAAAAAPAPAAAPAAAVRLGSKSGLESALR